MNMPYDLSSLTAGILDTEEPVLLPQKKVEEYLTCLENLDHSKIEAFLDLDLDKLEPTASVENGIGVISLRGPLTYKPSIFTFLFGGTTYEGLLSQMKDLTSRDDVHTILLDVDGPGGQAYRMMETGRQMRKLADESGKKVVAYVDGISASATAGITASAHEIVMNPESEFGSIGVVIRLVSGIKAAMQEGYEIEFITGGKDKVPFDKKGSFKSEYLDELQVKVDSLYDKFTGYVADLRGVSQETIKNTEARMLSAEDAVRLGLVDKIMEAEEFYTYLGTEASSEEESPTSSATPTTTASGQQREMSGENMPDVQSESVEVSAEVLAQLKEAQAKLAELTAKQEADAAALAAFKLKEEARKKEELSSEFGAEFLAEFKEDLVSFCMDSNVSESQKELIKGVVTAAAVYQSELEDACAEKVAAAEEKAEAVREEFATAQTSVEGEAEEQVSGGAQAALDAKIAKLKAAQNK
jgi:ClpP class serine protease